jgi:hypothetical protein
MDAKDWQRQAQTFEAIGYYMDETGSVFVNNRAERLKAAAVSPGWFEAMGVKPVLGRLFTPDEQKPNAARRSSSAIISGGGYTGGDRDALGSSLKLDGDPYTIVGVLPGGVSFSRQNGSLGRAGVVSGRQLTIRPQL